MSWIGSQIARSILLTFVACCGAFAQESPPLQVGSKNFTESVILAEIVRADAGRHGLSLVHRRALGGSAIPWQALRDGSIDLYPEYTGTVSEELLKDVPPRASIEQLRERLTPLGIGISAPLGFEDSYALGVPDALATRLDLHALSDLSAHPELRYGLSSEFLNRGDGWNGLRLAYGLRPQALLTMDHDLAYRGLQSQSMEVMDLYTTDAEIPFYKLRTLVDDRHYFPSYQAVLLYRLDALTRAPVLKRVLDDLAGRIDVGTMQRMNADVKLNGRSEAAVAQQFLGIDSTASKSESLAGRLARRTGEHLWLVGISLGLAILIGLPLGILAAQSPKLGHAVIGATSVLQTIPALAMLVFLIPIAGIGARPAIIALFFYSLLPIARNTASGLLGIAPGLMESAQALGLSRSRRLFKIELPLASRSILAGISTAAVIDVGTATLGALIGAGGYGEPILSGIRLADTQLILEGAIPAALLALAVQGAFQRLETRLTRRDYRHSRAS